MTTPTPKPDDGGPAFAAAFPAVPTQHDCLLQSGMTIRSYFAGQALQGLITGTDMAVVDMKDGYHEKTMAIVIDAAVSYADALLERLKR